MHRRHVRAAGMRGRDTELAAVDRVLRSLAEGLGGVVLIEGEAGIGKSRLLEEAQRRGQAHGVRVVDGAAEELEQSRPFGALIRSFEISARSADTRLAAIARRLELGASDDPLAVDTSGSFLVQEAFIELMEDMTAEGPTALLIDDLQWADRATVRTLTALCRRTGDLSLLLVLARRPFPASCDRLLDVAAAHGAVWLQLEPLGTPAVEELTAELAGAPPGRSLLVQLDGARGNPFFVIELVNALCEARAVDRSSGRAEVRMTTLPPSLRQTILRRVRSLSPRALELVRSGAVLGRSFSLEALGLLLERPLNELRDDALAAVGTGLLEDDGLRFRIRHDLIREAVYADTPAPIRVSLHRRAATVLAEHGEPPVVVAEHVVLGDDGSPAGARALLRAVADLAPTAPAEALTLLDRVEAADRLEPQERSRLAADRVALLTAVGRLSEAEAVARRALAAAPPSHIAAGLRIELAEALLMAGNGPAAVEHLVAAQAAGSLGDERYGDLLAVTASARLAAFDLDGAARDAEEAEAWARHRGAAAVLSSALAVQSRLAAYAADFPRAVRLGEAAVLASEGHSSTARRTPHLYHGLALLNADRADEAVAVLAAGRKEAEAAGLPWAIASYYHAVVMCGFHGGSWDHAIAVAEAGRSLFADAGTRAAYLQMESMLGLLWLHRACYDQARDALARAEADFAAPGHDAGGVIWLLWLQASFAEMDNQLDEATRLLGAAFDLAVQVGVHSVKLWYGPELVRLALAAGDRERAEQVAAAVDDVGRRAATASARGAAAWCTGLMAGDADRLLAAVAAFRATSRGLDRVRVSESAGAELAERGRDDEAIAVLDEALEVCDRLGADHDARRITASLRALGVYPGVRGPRQRPTTGPASLTPTERTVLDLVGAGLRNAEIAERLFVSRRTVETHVGRLYAKLQVRGRVALARCAPEVAATG